jgi:hypothetical protein
MPRVSLYRLVKTTVTLPNGQTRGIRRSSASTLARGRPPKDLCGPYYLRYQHVDTGIRAPWPSVGNDLAAAIEARNDNEAYLEARAKGVLVAESSKPQGRLISEAILDYLSEIKALKSRSTTRIYRYALARFQKSCKKKTSGTLGRLFITMIGSIAELEGR